MFEREKEIFKDNLPYLKGRYPGQAVLIIDGTINIFSDREVAVKQGIKKYGCLSFFTSEIDTIPIITRGTIDSPVIIDPAILIAKKIKSNQPLRFFY